MKIFRIKKTLMIISLFTFVFTLEIPLDRTAILLEKGKKEIGVFHPYRLGKTEEIELSIHPILGFIIPNFKMKGKIHIHFFRRNGFFGKNEYY